MKKDKDIYYMKCKNCGNEGYYEYRGYIGRCDKCGSYNVEIKKVTKLNSMKKKQLK